MNRQIDPKEIKCDIDCRPMIHGFYYNQTFNEFLRRIHVCVCDDALIHIRTDILLDITGLLKIYFVLS